MIKTKNRFIGILAEKRNKKKKGRKGKGSQIPIAGSS
jgi:hypothetical protein